MKDKNILLGVTGGIACYKSCDLVSKLRQKGANVNVVMTESAREFVTPLTFNSLSGNKVFYDLFRSDKSVVHVELAEKADAIIVAPATANIIGKMANGIGDDILSTILLASTKNVFLAPAMNINMYENPIVQKNIESLKELGVRTIGPNEGNLACGTVGRGRMAEPIEIIEAMEDFFTDSNLDLLDFNVLVTAGGTREPIDPVRYIGNRSSGKMGYSLANSAAKRGANVTLIATTLLETGRGVNNIFVESAEEMYREVEANREDKDIIIMAAAVADFKPKNTFDEKFKKNSVNKDLTIELEKTIDILEKLGKNKKDHQVVVGFAAETEDLTKNAVGKLNSKNIDIIVANDVSRKDIGFGSDDNIVTIFDSMGDIQELPLMDKNRLASEIYNYILKYSLKRR